MRTVLNIIWLIFAGFWMAISYVLAGIVCCILIITIPFGIAAFRIAGYALWPFGRTAVPRPDAGSGSIIGNVIWLIFAGIWLAIGHIVTGVALCLTIIGIPLGLGSFKMVPLSLLPLGKMIVPSDAVYGFGYAGTPVQSGPGSLSQPGYGQPGYAQPGYAQPAPYGEPGGYRPPGS